MLWKTSALLMGLDWFITGKTPLLVVLMITFFKVSNIAKNIVYHQMTFCFQKGDYRSIMSYQIDSEERVNYYSSSAVYYKGYPTGTSADDNARTLTEVRFAVANFGEESLACPWPTSI